MEHVSQKPNYRNKNKSNKTIQAFRNLSEVCVSVNLLFFIMESQSLLLAEALWFPEALS